MVDAIAVSVVDEELDGFSGAQSFGCLLGLKFALVFESAIPVQVVVERKADALPGRGAEDSQRAGVRTAEKLVGGGAELGHVALPRPPRSQATLGRAGLIEDDQVKGVHWNEVLGNYRLLPQHSAYESALTRCVDHGIRLSDLVHKLFTILDVVTPFHHLDSLVL